tara:strand:- start:33 stop:254 length:222 start_codon:yes stop_codon:yes gene_type:complete
MNFGELIYESLKFIWCRLEEFTIIIPHLVIYFFSRAAITCDAYDDLSNIGEPILIGKALVGSNFGSKGSNIKK